MTSPTPRHVTYPCAYTWCPTCKGCRDIPAARGPVDDAPQRQCELGHLIPGFYGHRESLKGESWDYLL